MTWPHLKEQEQYVSNYKNMLPNGFPFPSSVCCPCENLTHLISLKTFAQLWLLERSQSSSRSPAKGSLWWHFAARKMDAQIVRNGQAAPPPVNLALHAVCSPLSHVSQSRGFVLQELTYVCDMPTIKTLAKHLYQNVLFLIILHFLQNCWLSSQSILSTTSIKQNTHPMAQSFEKTSSSSTTMVPCRWRMPSLQLSSLRT